MNFSSFFEGREGSTLLNYVNLRAPRTIGFLFYRNRRYLDYPPSILEIQSLRILDRNFFVDFATAIYVRGYRTFNCHGS